MTTALRPDDLVRRCDPSTLPFDTTAEQPAGLELVGQDRAVAAVRFALGMPHDGYNLLAVGPEGVGKETIVRELLVHAARLRPTPPDLAYVLDLAAPHRPKALALPPGTGARLRTDLAHALARLACPTGEATTRAVFDSLRATYRDLPLVTAHLDAVERDLTDAIDVHRYGVNLLVDHDAHSGAPIIVEENPTPANLLGRIAPGALATDVMRVRPGSLHRANGGYLLLDAAKLLQQPHAWDALTRALRTREIRIEAPVSAAGLAPAASPEPEPIQLDTKVILFCSPAVHDVLAELDPALEDHFKVVADFAPHMDRTPEAETALARLIAALALRGALRPFDRGAVARVVEHASRAAGDAQKLSVHLRSIGDLLREASDEARRAGRKTATAVEVDAAVTAQRQRAGRPQAELLEAIRRRTLLIDTRGEVVGQINALSVVELGCHAFAHPARITACARLGQGEVIDIEREVELGGPVHSKGVMILAGLIGARYALHTPLSLTVQIVFEQSYAGVEGDSASLAELCVLLSAIGGVPLRQGLAITGSINLLGAIQPVGMVNEKIEGFFDVCREQGLTGAQGMIIPRANVQHLMLRDDVVAAVTDGRFHVHAVQDLDAALSLLTGRPAASVHATVEARLRGFSEDARRFLSGGPAHDGRHLHAG